MNIIHKKVRATAAALIMVAYHPNTTASTIDPSELSDETGVRATTTIKQAIQPPTVAWHAVPGVDTDVMDGAHIGAIRIEKNGGGRICVRTDADGKFGDKYVMTNAAGDQATMTLEEVAVIPRKLDPTTSYDTAGCTTSTNTNILLALKKSGDGMKAGEYLMNLYFAIWDN
ncbi:hypothetical protein HBD75_004556 [Salmonella enterica]|nr:hypothetical protein [Salmonella enterica]EEU4806706.1 hypothetical protein [Salmonella enterica]EEU4869848.1 hypothetical protein [Salmonella enterica]EEU4897473.1 hypothetical protein [Salmonella enterica]